MYLTLYVQSSNTKEIIEEDMLDNKAKRRSYDSWKHWWSDNNIFNLRLGDALGYFVFYIAIPTIVTVLSLIGLSDEAIHGVYCYISIIVSAGSAIYDNLLRLNVEEKSKRNFKLILMLASEAVVWLYCFFEILAISMLNTMSYRCDLFLTIYIIAIFVACIEIFNCIKKCVDIASCS